MRARRRLLLTILGAGTLAATAAAPLLAQSKGGGEAPATLTLAVWDQPGRQAEQAALDLVALAPELSAGGITVSEPVWGVGDAAGLVSSGQVDLAILATREWSPLGVASLDALEAPFLIDGDTLAAAVATSDVADAAMAGLADLGVTGLVMWPEDLRHLFAFEPFGRAFTTPEDVSGSTILAIAGQPGQELITSLGGQLYEEGIETATQTGDRVLDSQSGALDGMVTGLWGAGLSTDQIDGSAVAGDLVLYPKFQMLVANSESLSRLNDDQRAAFDEIVDEVHRLALDRQSSEPDLAAGICERGGTVIEAGPEAIAELQVAARPLTDAMAADPVIDDLMTRIRSIAEQTPDDGGAGGCAPSGPAAIRTSTTAPAASEALAGYTGSELLPAGTYRVVVTAAELEAAGARRHFATINDGTWTLTITDGGWELAHDGNRASPSQPPERCSGTQEVLDGSVRFTTAGAGNCGYDYDIRWRLEDDTLSLRLATLPASHTAADLADEQSFFELTWTRIDGPAASALPVVLPRDGAYRAEITVEDLEARGIDPESAAGNAGVVTWTLAGSEATLRFESGAAAGSVCTMTVSPVDGAIRFGFLGQDDCDPGEYDLTFTVEDGALVPTVVATVPAADLELTRAFFERPWTHIADGATDDASARDYPVSDATGFASGPPPDGIYRADITREDLMAKGVAAEWAHDNSGVFTITFDDGAYVFDHAREPACDGTYEALGPSLLLRNAPGGCAPTMNIMWRPEPDGISILLALPTEEVWPLIDFTNIQAHLEGRTWTRIG